MIRQPKQKIEITNSQFDGFLSRVARRLQSEKITWLTKGSASTFSKDPETFLALLRKGEKLGYFKRETRQLVNGKHIDRFYLTELFKEVKPINENGLVTNRIEYLERWINKLVDKLEKPDCFYCGYFASAGLFPSSESVKRALNHIIKQNLIPEIDWATKKQNSIIIYPRSYYND